MKILFIGAATSNHTKRWVNSLSKRGHEVLLVSRNDQKDEKKEIVKSVEISYLPFGGGMGYYLNVPALRRIYKRFKPDVTNVHYATGYTTLARLSKIKNLVVSCWGSDIYDFPKKSTRNLKLLKKNLSYADAVASTSIAMGEEVKKVMSDDNFPVTITPFGVDTKLFSPKNKKQDNKIVIGFVKYMEPIYDVPLLLNSFKNLKDICTKEVELRIYGDGTLKGKMIELSKELGIDKSVIFFPTIPNIEVPQALNTFDIFVNCSKQESFGVAIVEAMACELPIVATNTEGFREVVDKNITGFIMEDRNPETMASLLFQLIENEELRNRFGKAGREKVLKYYDWEKNVITMENLYKKVC